MFSSKFKLPARLGGKTDNVWEEYTQLAFEYKPLNLGQGFPDFEVPDYLGKALVDIGGEHDSQPLLYQYTRGFGHPRLVNAVSKLYSNLLNREINANTEILITLGAYGALFAAIVGHVDEGDEVIIIEPFFDCYDPMVRIAGGIPRFIPLKPIKKDGVLSSADWVLDEEELRSLFNEKTKIIILNTPHNPLGKVFNLKEIELIAELCKQYNVMCISDEVYERMVYKPNTHIRIATLPDMWERTITIGSAGKTFSATGWKIGWAYGPEHLIRNLQVVHQNSIYTCNTTIQEAIARALEIEMSRIDSPDCYFFSLATELESKRDFMVKALYDAGMNPIIPQGGYFIIADWTKLTDKVDLSKETDTYKDYRFTKYMTKNVGLLGIPPSAFYSKDNKYLGEDYVRFCFVKKDENLKKAANILRAWSNGCSKYAMK